MDAVTTLFELGMGSWKECEAMVLADMAATSDVVKKHRAARPTSMAFSDSESVEQNAAQQEAIMEQLQRNKAKDKRQHKKSGRGRQKQKSKKQQLAEAVETAAEAQADPQPKTPAPKRAKMDVQKLPRTRNPTVMVGGKVMPKKAKSTTSYDFIRSPGAPPPKSAEQKFQEKKQAKAAKAAEKAQAKEEAKRRKVGRPRLSEPDEEEAFVDWQEEQRAYETDHTDYESQGEGEDDAPAEEKGEEREPGTQYEVKGAKYIQHPEFKWEEKGTCEDPPESLPNLGFADEVGTKGSPSIPGGDQMSPCELVMAFFDSEHTVPRLVRMTNLKAKQFRESGGKTAYDELEPGTDQPQDTYRDARNGKVYGVNWKDVTDRDILMYLAICWSMAYVHIPRTQEYWSETLLDTTGNLQLYLRTQMSHNRWRQIKKFFCFDIVRRTDLHEDGPRKGKLKDKLHRSRYLLKVMQRSFRSFWRPGTKWSGDEGLISFYGRLCPIKVYIPIKPDKYGMKVWSLNDSDTGYLYHFHVYEGSGDIFNNEDDAVFNSFQCGERVIIYMAQFLPPGSYLFCDRYFTTPRLCAYVLLMFGVYITGTMMSDAPCICSDILWKRKRADRPRGYFTWAHDRANHVVQICWMDRKPVSMCSSIHGANIDLGGVMRLTRANAGGIQNACHFVFV